MKNKTIFRFIFIIAISAIVGCTKDNSNELKDNINKANNYNKTLSSLFDSSAVSVKVNTYKVMSNNDTVFSYLIPTCFIDSLSLSLHTVSLDSSNLLVSTRSQCPATYFSDALFSETLDTLITPCKFGVDSSTEELTFLFLNITSNSLSLNNLTHAYNVEKSSIYVPTQTPKDVKVLGLELSFINTAGEKQYFFVEIRTKK